MKSPFDFFEKYLPKKCSKQNPLNPIIYIYDGEKLLGLYSFDPIKMVLYVSDYNKNKYYYMSMYQFYNEGWYITKKEYYEEIIQSNEIERNSDFPL